MNELIQYIADYGFAVIISVYLLVRMEKKIDTLSKSIDRLSQKNSND
ncbi:YvrJ family protein (plasmid) [Psychrobacillus glaciei]|uniref:YvrJ family protein n=1 Tax=Psychrobacillus glaciei TaxID=2283160 RepID=A0A5J6STA3_9BACI|nr:YvrJ family protein [Psychrobacillus glaciei]QFG01289.1 YvrJ family protein [Psychrobacillus glaciei]